jgi:hypothetical protein
MYLRRSSAALLRNAVQNSVPIAGHLDFGHYRLLTEGLLVRI